MSKTSGFMASALIAMSIGFSCAHGAEPKIAVTDLTYQERVSRHIRVVSASSRSSLSARGSESVTPSSYSGRASVDARSESSYNSFEGVYTYIEHGELRAYTADLKGALLKGGGVRLTQAKPYSGSDTEQIYDIIARIKQGLYPGADYVLFGTVSNIEFRQEAMRLPMTHSTTASLTLDLVADFSLISTRNYEVVASFSASGSGQDTKILARSGDRVAMNRGKVIQETSRTLADAAYSELIKQFGVGRLEGVPLDRQVAGRPEPQGAASPVKVY